MRVFISAPYTKGDPVDNTRGVILIAELLCKMGHVPFVPHLTLFWHFLEPHEPQFWYDYDNEWLKVCDAVLRLPGDSVGADNEVKLAQSLGIPVYYSVGDLRK